MASGYSIIDNCFNQVILKREEFEFSREFLDKAKFEWDQSPSKYDGIVMGVKSFSSLDNRLIINVFPMNFSWHRHIARSIASRDTTIPEIERIYPLCIVGLSYIKFQNEKKFIMGIKKSGNIDGGKLESIPQGFCDMKEGNLDTYLFTMLNEELHSELGADVNLGTFIVRAFAIDDTNSQYALIIEFDVKEDEVKKYLGKEGSEHEQIILVQESDLGTLIINPTEYMKTKGINTPPNLEIAPMTRAALEVYQELE